MTHIKRALIASLITLASCTSPPATQNKSSDEVSLTASHRSAANISRDQFRHPSETLAFFGVQANHTVVEVWPGAGWYTEILAPYLHDSGTYYAASFSPDAAVAFFRKSRADYQQKLAAEPVYSNVVITTLQPGLTVDIAPPASADRVLTFRNVHNWMKAGFAQEVFDSFYAALKPGGKLGVVEHRAQQGTALDEMISSGYVTEQYVIELAEAAGFEYLASSEINANPKDLKQYTAGVWSLPPTLRLGETHRDYYLAIGESDRMTLLFGKPINE